MDRWKYRAMPALAAIGITATCIAVSAEQATFGDPYAKRSPLVGGNGGAPFTTRCDDNEFLAGIEVTKEDKIHSIRPVCISYVDGRLGKPELGKLRQGMMGKNEDTKFCPSSAPVVDRMTVSADGFNAVGVWKITLRCVTFDARRSLQSAKSEITFEGHKTSPRILRLVTPADLGKSPIPRRVSASVDCPGGYMANGLHGRSGNFMDAIGLTCARLPSTAPGQALDVSFYHRLTTRFRGGDMALDVIPNGPKTNLTRLNKSGNFSGQLWSFQFVSEGTYRLHTEFRGDAMCLELINGGANNNQPQFQKCSTSEAQLWKLQADAGTYRITNVMRGSEMCLDIFNGGANNNQPELRKCGSFSGQRWLLTRTNRNAPLRGIN